MLDRFSPEALFVISGISQYTGAVIAVSMFDEAGPATIAWFRVIGAAVVLLAVSGRHLRSGWTRADLRAVAIFGVATALMNMFFYLAIDRIDLGKSVVMEFIGPIAVAAAFTRTRRNTIALLFAVLGVLVLSGVEIDTEPLGLLFILLASLMWATYIVIGRRVAATDRGVAGLAFGLAVGAIAIAPFGAPGSGHIWATPSLLVAALVVGVFSNAIGYGIDQHILRRIPVRRFALLLALLPVTAMIVGYIALDQRPSTLDLAGAVLVIAGVVVQERDELEVSHAVETTLPSAAAELDVPPA
jgi:inner membrane transporter RhtA